MGRHPDGKAKTYHVEHMWEAHHEVLRLLVLGRKPTEIAAITGFTEQFISHLRNSPIAQEQLAVLSVGRDVETVAATKIIASAQPKAAQLLKDVINGEVEATVGQQINTAQDMLSRGEHGHVQRVKADIRHGLTDATLALIKDRAAEAKEAMERDSVAADFKVEA